MARGALVGLLAPILVRSGWAAVLRHNLRASSERLVDKPSHEGYSFAQFVRDFGRSYVAGSQEYASRAAQFEASLSRINAVNARNAQEGRAWSAGVHPFMDWSEAERQKLNGYKPNRKHRASRGSSSFAALQTMGGTGAAVRLNGTSFGSGASWDGVTLRDQANCGSCWAFSAVEAIEARLPGKERVSAQALVDCVPNPRHCGGTGGCDGATGELAFAFVRDHGIPLESSYAYTGETGSCPMNPLTGPFPAEKRVRLSGWVNPESNKAQPLMEAIYNKGPVAVAVDGGPWFDYDHGVFDGCKKDAILGHGVLAVGYGGEGAGQYWRIQNSWGSNWGEKGHIRLKRRDAEEEEKYCGIDRKPQEGSGCDGGPPEITVCGMCGILFDPVYPEGVTIESGGDTLAPATSNPTSHGYDALVPSLKFEETWSQDFDRRHSDGDDGDLSEPPVVEDASSGRSAEDVMKNIFRPAQSPASVKNEMEKTAVDRMEALLHHRI